jgi:hypothetical protein
MENLQESAANTCVDVITPVQAAVSRRAPFMMEQFNANIEEERIFTKSDFEQEMTKTSHVGKIA